MKGAPKGHPKWGGKKKGNKHKKTIAQEMALETMREEIRQRMFGEDGLLSKKFELANGVWRIRTVKDSFGNVIETKVYKEKPDSQSLEYLFSMVVGKPKESFEVKGEIVHSDNRLIDFLKNADDQARKKIIEEFVKMLRGGNEGNSLPV